LKKRGKEGGGEMGLGEVRDMKATLFFILNINVSFIYLLQT